MTILVLLLPLVTALLIFIPSDVRVQRLIALAGSVLTFLASLGLANTRGVLTPWIADFGLYFELSGQGAAAVLIPAAALVMIPTLFYASLQIKERTGAFLALLLVMQASLNGIFMARDLVLFYVFWEVTLIPSIIMLGVWGREKRREAAMKYLVYAIAGSFLMLISILAIRPLSGAASYRFSDLLEASPLLPLSTQLWLFVGFAAAFAVKLPLYPLHNWLPDFHEQNHASGVADVAGTLYKVGGYGFFAWALPLLPHAAQAAAPVLLTLAAFTAIYAAMIATTQSNMKRLLAYASLSHMGIVGVGVFGLHLAGLNGAMFLLAAQMVSTGGLFLISGMLFERKETFELDDYGGLAKSAPILAALTLFTLFASIGVPGLGNFPGEFMSLMGAFQSNGWLATLATLAVVGAGVYGVNMYQRLYQGKEKQAVAEMGWMETAVLVPIVFGILWFGLAPHAKLANIGWQSEYLAAHIEIKPPARSFIAKPAAPTQEPTDEQSGDTEESH